MNRIVEHAVVRMIAAVLVLALAMGCTRAAFAQDAGDSRSLLEIPRARQGYWIGFGYYGIGSNLVEEGHNRGVYSGSGYTFRIGQLITERLGLGLTYVAAGSLFGGIKKGNDKGGLGGLILEGSGTIWRNLSIHTGLGVGYVYTKDLTAFDKSLRGGGGSYFLLGTSYDFFPWRKRLTGGWAITPTLDFNVSPDGNIKAYTLFAGVQVVRWSGLPNNMLVLPED